MPRVTCLIGACLCLWIAFTLFERGTDFNQFYSASQLAGTGHMYDWDRVQELELRNGSHPVRFGRLPVYGVPMKPPTALPYPYARMVWLLVNLAALIGFAALWPAAWRRDHHDAVLVLSGGQLLLPERALALRLPVPKALRYGALAPAVPFPYVLLMQEHGVWIVAQALINGVGLWLLGLLAWHGLRVVARTGRAASGPVALEDGTA